MKTEDAARTTAAEDSTRLEEERIRTWIVKHLALALEIDAARIDVNVPFDRYGLDSNAAVTMVGELEEWLQCELSPTVPYEYPTVAKLAAYLAGGREDEGAW